MEDPDPFIRDIMQEALRDVVTSAVTDNLIGAGEILTGMLPKVLAGIAVDLESKDWMIRSRAQAAVLKYAMEFKEKDTKDLDLGKITVTHQVAIPGTPIGRATVGEIEALTEAAEGELVEAYEKDYPTCWKCNERKHPDAVRWKNGKPVCMSCNLAEGYARGSDPTFLHDPRDPEFG